ncbi:xanthine phosphoribosyltransferase [Aneurinibacillus sp. Ricciae_BoGa-3]|uniref:xanthine phosphoribosyltransferase n=1 Tax=Aneurinibacillus sp. Ricciae_BoGa-3 TaxID=3022697 RepID=UPI00233FE7E1|nr:xanthine phosphoribosyltransferase [Aneurinibacillus sp. Ricciae_BoGa-3]WCK53765.1 xanthine phosphoribosyltransferase [Aneurinibacillus sp. Ricciae_BoGa-3]
MELLKAAIRDVGQVLNDNVLKVDSFLNHQIDPALMMAVGEEFARLFVDEGITRILTLESSGIAPALTAGLKLGVPVVFARKKRSAIMNEQAYHTQVYSFTKQETNEVTVLKKFLPAGETVLIIDDFLANGEAALGLASLVEQAESSVAGIGIVIEKAFQNGGAKLKEAGYRVESLARIASLSGGHVAFVEDLAQVK